MRISTVSVRPTRRRSIDLMVGTALGCSLLVLAAPARADDECGAAAPGATVTCAAAGSPYATGIDYRNVQDGMTLNIAAGTTVDALGQGVGVEGEGPISILAQGTTIRLTPIDAQTGIIAVYGASDTDVTVRVGTVEASGPEAVGIWADTQNDDLEVTGDITITADAVTVAGHLSRGVLATNDAGGGVTIDVGAVTATGDLATGIRAQASGVVRVEAESVVTAGQEAKGVDVSGDLGVELDLGLVDTTGDNAVAIAAISNVGAIEIEVDTIRTDGINADGVFAENFGGDSISVTAGDIVTRGDGSAGVVAWQYTDDGVSGDVVTVDVGSVVTGTIDGEGVSTGRHSHGVQVEASGDATVIAEEVTTHGYAARGVLMSSQRSVTADVGEVTTHGQFAHGVDMTSVAEGDVTVTAGSVHTTGDEAHGIRADANLGNVSITAEDIVTEGDEAFGVWASVQVGDVTLDLGDVRTEGDQAYGVMVYGSSEEGDTISIGAEDVRTTGQGSVGVRVAAFRSNTTIDVQSVLTDGDGATAIEVTEGYGGSLSLTADTVSTLGEGATAVKIADVGAVTLDLGAVSTVGDESRGIDIYRDDELYPSAAVVVSVDSVRTGDALGETGDQSDAINIYNAGATTLTVGTVLTEGSLSDGIVVDGADSGSVVITATGSVRTTNDFSRGIVVQGVESATVTVQNVSTAGDNSTAITIDAFDDEGAIDLGEVSLIAGDVATTGQNSSGVLIDAQGRVEATLGNVSTEGDTSRAVAILSATSDVELTTGTILTDGIASIGIDITAQQGEVVLTAGDVTTLSGNSRGVRVLAGGDVAMTLGDVTTHGASDSTAVQARIEGEGGILRLIAGDLATNNGPSNPFVMGNSALVISNAGLSDIDIASARTNSVNAAAIRADGGGDVDLTVTGAVATTGDRSEGVLVLGSDEVTIRAASVTTTGEQSSGVRVGASEHEVEGDVIVAIGQIRTSGDQSAGLDIETAGGVTVTSQDILTTGLDSKAVDIDAEGAVALTLGRVVASGADGVAVEASGATIDMTIAAELRGTRVGADLDAEGALAVTLGAGSTIAGSDFGLDLTSGTGTTVTNRGAISSAEGVALNVDGAAATIANIGSLTGRIDLTEAADRLDNSGTFRVNGDSDFGGATDVLANTGTVTFADSTTPVQARLRNLERFDNAGTIDLSNGVAGDVLILDGVLNGQAGNEVLLDLDTRTATVVADRLVVGSLEGVTNIELDVQGAGVIGETGVTLVTSAVAQTGQELQVTTAGGFLDYDAVFDAASREYRIVGAAAAQAWEPTKVASGAQMQWRRGADVISARFDDLRDSGAMGLRQGGGAQVWAQAFAGGGEIDGERVIDGQAVDLSHDIDVAGGQAGIDIVRGFGGGDLVVGLTGGVSETELEFHSNGDAATFTGFGLGAYAQWSSGPLAIGVLVKGDSYELEYDWVSADLSDEASGSTFGARVDAAWRIDAGPGWTIEPQASAWWTETDLSSISGDAGEVEFGDTRSLVGRAGVRVAHALTLASGARIQPFVGVYGFNEFDGDNASRIRLGSQTLDVADRAADLWGEAVLGANVGMGPIQGFVQGEAAFGEISGFTARVGARLNW